MAQVLCSLSVCGCVGSSVWYFLFLSIRRPPRATLCPSTARFRSPAEGAGGAASSIFRVGEFNAQDVANTNIDLIGSNSSTNYIGGPIVGQFDVAGKPYTYIQTRPCPQNCLSNNGLKITLKLKRRSINGIIQIIIPSLVLWLCAMLTLQYDVNDLTNRNRTSVTTLLVLVTLFGAINNKSDFPKTSGFKHIDVWFVWYLINIFLIICHHTAISKIWKGSKNENAEDTAEAAEGGKRKEIINRIISLVLFLLTFSFNVFYFVWPNL